MSMPNALNKEETLRRNLIDAGCSKALTDECVQKFKDGAIDDILPKLTAYRKCVLSDVHKCQKQIDCIDYLTSKIKSDAYKKEK